MSENINPRKTPLKGKPNFTSVSDERLKDYLDVIQEMCYAYKNIEGYSTLQKIWKDISSDLTDRKMYDTMTTDCFEDVEKKVVKPLKFRKPIRVK